MAEAKHKVIGRSLARREDPPLLTGQGRFAADINFPGQWIMRVVRSPVAHGEIKGIDASAALALPAVHAVWTYKDVAHIPRIPFRLTGLKTLEPYQQPVLADGVVRYVGEPVALVFADDAYIAEDAAELVTLDIAARDPIMDASGETGAFDETRTTEPDVVRKGYGDVETAFRNAHAVVSLELVVGRHTGVPMETRGAIATYDASRDLLEMHGAAKVPHWNRDALARMLGRAPETMHLHEGHVGGGFGIRGEIYPEDVAVCAAALHYKRPIKWIEDRREHLIAANHSRQQQHRVRAAIDRDGRITAIDDEFFHDNGAYMRTHAATVPDLAAAMLPGPYRVPAYRAVGHIRLTNKTPCGTYRAPGRYESTFVRERLMDAIAAQCGIDRVTVRRRNLLPQSAMPYDVQLDTLGTHIVYDSGDYALLLDKALRLAGWDELQAGIKARRAKGEKVGAGVAMFVEKSGLGPFDTVRIEIKQDGVEVVTGNASVGQGIETVVAQICAETLGAAYETINVVHGQTDRIARGMGAFASRVTVMCGEATRLAAVKLRDAALKAAAELMQTSAEKLDIADGNIVAIDGGASMPLTALAGLTAEDTFESSHMVYPYGVHVATVRVDGETGGVQIEKYAIAYDIGRAVNPRLVEGQLAGGLAQGIGGALYEEFLYDEAGEPLSVTFADYLMPTAHEVPAPLLLVTEDAPSPLNTLGLKGAGEGGANPVGAALASAIDDALQRPGAVTRLPVTPQRLKALIRR
ncbi:MAG TPA: xanthine dehydrogenase family protein molybdopterin-binding subunit [Pseudolabrys sp.]|uniref:xanthine dehydrogenase family protein molybdopterin-binding subunit n=1 Tax=Pseudolabrys sp. TaxID=1960880 RepID=UPI002DDDB4A0|nr:xanthine dehydrogenase family protein molybdopterin-binding subunit [Pseudolabrys sp.]HEV2627156.1 xanthine dehydrogenase family protein molybdopterin-binding subunit [Pseudolabrys sp.]